MPSMTLLDLVTAVAEYTHSEAEVITAVVSMVNSGAVRLCGTFKDATFDPCVFDGPGTGRSAA
jgi:hypothetical protein